MGQNTLKINEGICQRVIRTCKKSTLIWKNFPIKKYRGEGFLAKKRRFLQFSIAAPKKFQMAANFDARRSAHGSSESSCPKFFRTPAYTREKGHNL